MPDIIQRIQKLLSAIHESYTLEIEYDSFKISYGYSYTGIHCGYDKYIEYFDTINEVENYLVKELEPTATFNKP